MSNSSAIFCLFVAWNVNIIAFSYFRFVVIVVLLILMLFVSILVAVISLSLFFFYVVSSRLIDISTLFWMLTSPILPFLDTYSLSMSSLGCNTLLLVKWVECSPKVRETWVQSQVALSYLPNPSGRIWHKVNFLSGV